MEKASESVMVTCRLSKALVERVDYAVRNIPTGETLSRSRAIEAALTAWVNAAEQELTRLGVFNEETAKALAKAAAGR